MATQKKDKKVKIGTKSKSLGWTLDSQKFRVLSDDRLSELSLCGNLHNINLNNLGSATWSDLSKDSIILPTTIISAGIPIPFPWEVF